LSRFDGKFDSAGTAHVAPAELLAALGQGPSDPDRQDAIARSLSASEGWKEALRLMGGAFAPEVAERMVKDD
jgi:hypothetical protein